jgi:hypothetical protein
MNWLSKKGILTFGLYLSFVKLMILIGAVFLSTITVLSRVEKKKICSRENVVLNGRQDGPSPSLRIK